MPGSIQRTVGEIGERDGTQETQEARLPPEIPKKSQRNTKIFTEIQQISLRNPKIFPKNQNKFQRLEKEMELGKVKKFVSLLLN